MAIEYTIFVNAGEDDAARIDALLRDDFTSERHPGGRQNPAVVVVSRRPHPRSAGFVSEECGVMPTVRLSVRLDKFQLEASESQTARFILALLKTVSCDVVVLKNGELLALKRLDGVVRIDPNRGLWSNALLHELGKDFRTGPPLGGETLG